MIVLGGSSRQSLASLRGTLDEKLKRLSSNECTALSSDLFAALAALYSSVGLRRALTDPARDHGSKADLISDLFGNSLSAGALSILGSAVALRWSTPAQIAIALEQLAVEAEATAANSDGSLDRVEDELFIFGRLLIDNNDLRLALNTTADDADHKSALISDLFGQKAAPSTTRLLVHLVNGMNGRSVEATLAAYTHAVAARRNRLVALVRSRVELSAAQHEKLVATLTKQTGQPVHVNIEIDPGVIGGVAVRFADEVIDGTISTRLAEAGRALAV